VLDLFAGTGGMGIEALSRGAASCLFVERDRRTLRLLSENLRKLGLQDETRAWSENVWTLRIPKVEGGYGIVFLDPPYRDVENRLMMVDLIERIAARLSPEGVIVFRHDVRTDLPLTELRGVRCADERRIGRMRMLLLQSAPRIGEAEAGAPTASCADASAAPETVIAAAALGDREQERDNASRSAPESDATAEADRR
jgi:16S rRNA (guanine966-N2)-methyltransferase